jgi:hypothetical protein
LFHSWGNRSYSSWKRAASSAEPAAGISMLDQSRQEMGRGEGVKPGTPAAGPSKSVTRRFPLVDTAIPPIIKVASVSNWRATLPAACRVVCSGLSKAFCLELLRPDKLVPGLSPGPKIPDVVKSFAKTCSAPTRVAIRVPLRPSKEGRSDTFGLRKTVSGTYPAVSGAVSGWVGIDWGREKRIQCNQTYALTQADSRLSHSPLF